MHARRRTPCSACAANETEMRCFCPSFCGPFVGHFLGDLEAPYEPAHWACSSPNAARGRAHAPLQRGIDDSCAGAGMVWQEACKSAFGAVGGALQGTSFNYMRAPSGWRILQRSCSTTAWHQKAMQCVLAWASHGEWAANLHLGPEKHRLNPVQGSEKGMLEPVLL